MNIDPPNGSFKKKDITNYLATKEDIKSIIDGTSSGLKEQLIAGVSGTARSIAISSLYDALRKKTLVITHQLIHAQQLYEDVAELVGDANVFLYPVNELIATEMVISSPELRAERIQSVVEWLQREDSILIVPIAALKRILPPKSYWETYRVTFTAGDKINLESIMQKLFDMGYERVDMVTSPAEFSIRGGIIDIYPVTQTHPFRIELFDDEVDSIRYFDANTQRSLDNVTTITIAPARELLVTNEDMMRAANLLEKKLIQSLRRMKASESKEMLEQSIQHDIDMLQATEKFQGMYKYSELFYENPNSL